LPTAQHFILNTPTVVREGKIRAVTTEGGKYRILYSEIKKYLELFTHVS